MTGTHGYNGNKSAKEDECSLLVTITPAGMTLHERAVTVPESMAKCAKLTPQEAAALYKMLGADKS